MSYQDFLDRLPLQEIYSRVWPDQTVKANGKGWAKVRCPLPTANECHKNGDRDPSFSLKVDSGGWTCRVCNKKGAIKALVCSTLGEDEWDRYRKQANPELTPEEHWRLELKPETAWTECYSIAPELSECYLCTYATRRGGPRGRGRGAQKQRKPRGGEAFSESGMRLTTLSLGSVPGRWARGGQGRPNRAHFKALGVPPNGLCGLRWAPICRENGLRFGLRLRHADSPRGLLRESTLPLQGNGAKMLL